MISSMCHLKVKVKLFMEVQNINSHTHYMQKIENLLNPNGKTYSPEFNSNFNGVKICLKRASSCLVPSPESSLLFWPCTMFRT